MFNLYLDYCLDMGLVKFDIAGGAHQTALNCFKFFVRRNWVQNPYYGYDHGCAGVTEGGVNR